MKKLVHIIILMLSYQLVAGQGIDEEKMNRDLEVAKNILATLINNESEMFMEGRGIEADYLEGYGVIITIPRHFVYFHVPPPPKIKPPKVKIKSYSNGRSSGYVIDMDKEEETESKDEALREQEKAMKEQEKAMKAQEEAMARVEEEIAKAQKEAEKAMQEWRFEANNSGKNIQESVITFLADYADLIGQLNPDDKIMVKQESPYEEFNFVWVNSNDSDSDIDVEVENEGDSEAIGFSMEVTKKDITNYKSGRISLDEFKSRVKKEEQKPAKKVADLEMFANIFKQFYSPKLSKTFFTEGTPTYEVLEDYGAIFKAKTYSSYIEGKLYYMPVLGNDKVDSEERRATIEKLYPEFINDIKNFIVDYGRTIRSLDDDQILLLKIGMTRCENCSIPKSIEVSVSMSVLHQFDQQKISREKAMQAIEIKENPKS